MREESATYSMIEIVTAVLPIMTFFVGTAYGYFDKVRDARRRVANTRSIVLKELAYNYDQINVLWPPNGDMASVSSFGMEWASLLETVFENSLTMRVYTAYLGRFDTLAPEELDKIFDAYNTMYYGLDLIERFPEKENESAQSRREELAAFVVLVESTLDRLEAAINALPNGPDVLNELRPKRGEQIALIPEMHKVRTDEQPQ